MKGRRTTEQFLLKIAQKRKDNALIYDYSKVKYESIDGKITIICKIHGDFSQRAGDHVSGSGCPKCGRLQAQQTNFKIYGGKTPMSSDEIKKKRKNKFIEKYGVDNPSKNEEIKKKKIETCLKNYGVEHPRHSSIVKNKSMETSIKKYGVPYPMQNKDIAAKGTATKVLKGGFAKSNSSKEASTFIRSYIEKQGYSLDQCAFDDEEYELHEWGIYHNGRWILYDLVIFESGHRGDKQKIIEILEYHGPFHYNENDVQERGNKQAFPWKSNKMTIEESFNRDREKENLAKMLTNKYTIVWSEKYHIQQGDL
jgi:hypothetical protein